MCLQTAVMELCEYVKIGKQMKTLEADRYKEKPKKEEPKKEVKEKKTVAVKTEAKTKEEKNDDSCKCVIA